MKPLTDKQKELLDFVDSQIVELDKGMTKLRHQLKNLTKIKKYFQEIRVNLKS